jgi:hypothetical protein
MRRPRSESKTGQETAKARQSDALEPGRGRSGRAVPKKVRDDALARERARERAARADF